MSTTAVVKAREFLPFHRALIEQEEIDAVVRALQSGWITTGPRVAEFEAAFARYLGAAHAVAVSSCTAALHLALAAMGIAQGDEVIVPTMTFAACGEAILYLGARPVLVDCQADSFHAGPAEIEQAITPRTRAILVVHYGGWACDLDAIGEIARRHQLKIIEDAAHALPTRYKGKLIGATGDVTCFSFYATKTLTTGEGGMATTSNPEYADRLRRLSLHGVSRDAWKRYTAEGSWKYDILELGYKYNMTDVQAALGLAQLSKCDAMRARRACIAARYTRELASLPSFRVPDSDPEGAHAWHLYVVRTHAAALRIGRDQVIEELKRGGIGTSVHFIPLHLHTLYQQLGYRPGQFPNAEEQFAAAISLPIYPSMTDDDTGRVIQTLRDLDRQFRK